jgi:hypothetical protein
MRNETSTPLTTKTPSSVEGKAKKRHLEKAKATSPARATETAVLHTLKP